MLAHRSGLALALAQTRLMCQFCAALLAFVRPSLDLLVSPRATASVAEVLFATSFRALHRRCCFHIFSVIPGQGWWMSLERRTEGMVERRASQLGFCCNPSRASHFRTPSTGLAPRVSRMPWASPNQLRPVAPGRLHRCVPESMPGRPLSVRKRPVLAPNRLFLAQVLTRIGAACAARRDGAVSRGRKACGSL